MTKLVVDFVGMFLVIEDISRDGSTKALTVGCLDEPGHVHTIHYFDHDRQVRVAALRGLPPSVVLGAGTGGPTLITNGRLRDAAADGGGTATNLDDLVQGTADEPPPLFFRFQLQAGKLEALEAHITDGQSRWMFGADVVPQVLTDRLRYTVELDADTVALPGSDPIELQRSDSGEAYAVVTAIDGDYGLRRTRLLRGLPLTEYALFYTCTAGFGPVPVAVSGPGAHPKRPICPVGYVRRTV